MNQKLQPADINFSGIFQKIEMDFWLEVEGV
jgi:hypothetical protein